MKTALFVPLPEYGHIIPTIKLGKRLLAEGWKVSYYVYEEFRDFLESHGFEVIIDQTRTLVQRGKNNWKYPSLEMIDTQFCDQIDDIESYDLILFDTLTSFYSVRTISRGIPSVTYHTGADCDSYRSHPLYLYIKSKWLQRVPLFGRFCWFWMKAKDVSSEPKTWIRNLLSFQTYPQDKKFRRETKRLRLRTFPNIKGVVSIDNGTIVLGPRCLSQKHLEADRYFGFCMDDASIEESALPEDFLNQHRSISYCSLGSESARYPNARYFLECVASEFAKGELGGVVIQAGSYASELQYLEGTHVRVVSHIDQKSLLKRCEYVITHGGYGTLKECVSAFRPVLLIPCFMDQFHNATVVNRLGIGEVLRPGQVSPDSLRQAFLKLKEGSVKARAEMGKLYSRSGDNAEFERAFQSLLNRCVSKSETGDSYHDSEKVLVNHV